MLPSQINVSRLDTNMSPLISHDADLLPHEFGRPNRQQFANMSGDLNRFSSLRKDLTSHLEQSSRKRSDNQSLELKIQKIKEAFQQRYAQFVIKHQQSEQRHLARKAILILKAFTKQRHQEKIESKMAHYCLEQLEFLKTKRLFRQLKLYGMWQKQWVAQVRTNAQNRQMRQVFRDILLHSSLRRFKRFKRHQMFRACIAAIQEQAIETNAKIAHRQRQRKARMRASVFVKLEEHRAKEVFLKRCFNKIKKWRQFWVIKAAYESCRVYREASLKYKDDLLLAKVFEDEDTWYDKEKRMLVCGQDAVEFFGVTAKTHDDLRMELEMGPPVTCLTEDIDSIISLERCSEEQASEGGSVQSQRYKVPLWRKLDPKPLPDPWPKKALHMHSRTTQELQINL